MRGILNGVDYDEWRTVGNPYLAFPFSLEDPSGKALNKAAIQAELGLVADASIPLFGTVGRLAEQKGVDLILGALEEMLSVPMQFVALGTGQPEFQAALTALARRHPRQVSVRIGFDGALSHRIEAGCDFFVMPSRFEPCGLNQMYSLRYGTIPIVRRTGGLDDSVADYREDPEHANGIKFDEYSGRALAKAMRKALALYAQPDWLEHYRRNAMGADFSWDRTRVEYEQVYRGFSK
jgi:starch synthase